MALSNSVENFTRASFTTVRSVRFKLYVFDQKYHLHKYHL